MKEDKEEIEEQRRLRQEEEERSLVTVSFFKKYVVSKKKINVFQNCLSNAKVLISHKKQSALVDHTPKCNTEMLFMT